MGLLTQNITVLRVPIGFPSLGTEVCNKVMAKNIQVSWPTVFIADGVNFYEQIMLTSGNLHAKTLYKYLR